MDTKKIKNNKVFRTVFEYTGILVGTALTVLAASMFIVPNKFAPGGYSGLATVLYYVTGMPVGTVTFAASFATQLVAARVLGRNMGIKSFVCSLFYGVFLDIATRVIPPFTDDVLLASVFGGVLYGVGMGVLYRMGGSGGGMDLLARMFQKITKRFSLSVWIMMLDFCVIVVAGLVFRDISIMLYSIIVMFLYTQVMDFIITGNNYAKAANIISGKSDEICQRIREDLNKSATIFHAYGAYSGEQKEVVYCIVYYNQIGKLKQLVRDIDPDAFMTLEDVQEVLGAGFKNMNE